MAQRFEPWPEWLILCDNSFNFLNDLDTFDRKLSFEKLLDMPYSVKSLDSNERTCLITEYLTFLFNAREVVEELNGGTIKQVWYKLLTIVYYFKTCKFINHYALQLLTRSFNGALWKPRCRRLKEFKLVIGHSKMKTQKNLISSNSMVQNPLMSTKIVEEMLTRHFGEDWHFTLANSRRFVSKVVDRQFKSAEDSPNLLARFQPIEHMSFVLHFSHAFCCFLLLLR